MKALALLFVGIFSSVIIADNGFEFPLGEKLFTKGAVPQLSDVNPSSWKLAGIASFTNSPFFPPYDGYDLNGLSNDDGSALASLVFTPEHQTGTDFAGNPIIANASVTIEGLGKQGLNSDPNSYFFDSTAQALRFTQLASSISSSITDSEFEYRCRLVAASNSKMVCQMIAKLSSVDPLSPELARWNGKVFQYRAFVKN